MKSGPRTLAIIACVALASCAGWHDRGSADRAVLSMGPGGIPQIQYAFAPGESEIAFAQHESTAGFARTHFWSFDRTCFALDGSWLRRLRPACGDAIVRLDWDNAQRPATYPGLVRLQNGGVLVFTGYLQPLTPDRSRFAAWRAVAPPDAVVQYLDEKSSNQVLLDAHRFPNDPSGWVYIGPDRFVSHRVATTLVDDGISPRLADEMLRIAPRLLETYERRLGTALPAKPIFYLTWINRDGPGRSFQADVVPGPVVKFTPTGSGWKNPSAHLIDSFRATEAHEFAHFWSRFGGQSTPWVREGGAEVLSWAAMHATGLLDDGGLADHVDAAYDECAILAGSNAWRAIKDRDEGRYPYACGAVMQIAAIVLARLADPSADAFTLWKGVLAGEASDEKTLTAFLHHASPDSDRLLESILGSDRPLLESLQQIFQAGHIRTQTAVDVKAGLQLRLAVANRTFAALMSADCGGNAAWDAQRFVTLPLDGCHRFRTGMRIDEVEGIPLLAKPIEALQRARSACDQGKEVQVAVAGQGELRIACDASTPLPRLDALRSFDPVQVSRLLDGGPETGDPSVN